MVRDKTVIPAGELNEFYGDTDAAVAPQQPAADTAVTTPAAPLQPHYTGHRARLRARFLAGGEAAVADYEILELLLFAAIPRGDVKPLAKTLLARFGSLARVLEASPQELQQVKGVGETAAASIKIARAAAQRLLRQQAMDAPVMRSWENVVGYCRLAIGHSTVEKFHLLFLDHHNRLMFDEEQNRGTISHTAVYPREIARRALELGASAVIMVHNHPSGDTTPSQADIEMTRKVAAALSAVHVSLHDHIVVSGSGHSSLRGLGMF